MAKTVLNIQVSSVISDRFRDTFPIWQSDQIRKEKKKRKVLKQEQFLVHMLNMMDIYLGDD